MDAAHYFHVLRRRWYIIAACVVLGLVAGIFVLGDSGSADPETRYFSTHTLIYEPAAGEAGDVSLDQAAYFATLGDVPEAVADRIGGDPLDLATQMGAVANPSLGTLELRAVDPAPDRAIELADTFATELVLYLDSKAQTNRDDQIEELQAQVDNISISYQDEVATAAGLPEAEVAISEARQQAMLIDLTDLERQIEQIQRQPVPSSGLQTLQSAGATKSSPNNAQTFLEERPTEGQLQPRSEQASASTIARAGLGGFLGLMVGIGIVLVINRFDPRIMTKREAEDAYHLPVIAEIPPLSRSQQEGTEIMSIRAPRSPSAEAYRALRSALVFFGAASSNPTHAPAPTSGEGDASEGATAPGAGDGNQTSVIMVTSAGPAVGKTTSVANLAVVLAEAGFSVLALNCDFRKPQLHRYLDSEDAAPRHVIETAVPGVHLIRDVVGDSARTSPSDVIAEQRRIIDEASGVFDILLLDTAPLLTTNDAVDLLDLADLVVIVSRVGKTTHDAAERTVELLERHDAKVAGALLVGADEGPSSRYYYYYSSDYHAAPGDHSGDNGNGPSSAGRSGSAPHLDDTESDGVAEEVDGAT